MQNNLQLTKQSFTIIKQRKSLLIFPAIATTLTLILLYFIFNPVIHIEVIAWTTNQISAIHFAIFICAILLFFAFSHLITQLFQAALTSCAIKHIQGETYSILFGFKMMCSHFTKIFYWNFIMTTFGIGVVKMQYWMDNWREKKFLDDLLSGLPWVIATTFVTPVLIKENLKTFAAIKKSAQLIKNTWDAPKFLRIKLGRTLSLIRIIAFIPLIIAIFVGIKKIILFASIFLIVVLICVHILHAALRVITVSALYLFANKH